jgi:hypothetical protein
LTIVDRRRIVVADPGIRGAKQPYHHAATLKLEASETYLANGAAVSERLALAAVAEVVRELDARRYHIVGCAVLTASGRPLPSLSRILSSHALIHAAEGEVFRDAVRQACGRLGIPVTGIPERELDERANAAFGKGASEVQRRIASRGSSIGPPWTKDHKAAALAASMILLRPRPSAPTEARTNSASSA